MWRASVFLLMAAGCTAELGSAREDRSGYAIETTSRGVDISVWSGRVTDSEMDCFWDNGVRHVIVGTQELGIARQQMEMAVARGMTVDTYVYLVWDRDVAAQVRTAVEFSRSYPVGMLWLDVEHEAGGLGTAGLEDRIQDAVDACGDFPCGIYTAEWWWTPNMGRSAIVADLPLWYALYDGNPDTSTWSQDRFGAWSEPWGKQYAGDLDLCGIDVDLNTIRVTTTASRPHPAPIAAPPGLPAQPVGLAPTGDEIVPSWLDVRMLSAAVPGASGYEFAIEKWNGASYSSYFTYSASTNARAFSPTTANVGYRFRVRATNGSGAGPWSAWSYFRYGNAPPSQTGSEPPPTEPPPTEPPPTEPPPTEPATGDPSPADGASIASGSVTLSRGAVSGASRYEFEIDYSTGGAYAHYYTYTGSSSSRTFWPSYDASYRWRVRATTSAGVQAWSAYASFQFGAGATEPPPSEPPPSEPPTGSVPTGLTPNGATITTASVTLACSAVSGATSYELAIEYAVGGSFVPYYTYTASAPSKTFYPATRGTQYRFRVRARTASGWSAPSSYATFDVL